MGYMLKRKTDKTVFPKTFLKKYAVIALMLLTIILSALPPPAYSQTAIKSFTFTTSDWFNHAFFMRSEYFAFRSLDAYDKIVAFAQGGTCYVFYDGYNIRNVTVSDLYALVGVHVFNSTHIMLLEIRGASSVIYTKIRNVNILNGNEVSNSYEIAGSYITDTAFATSVRGNTVYIAQYVYTYYANDELFYVYRYNVLDNTLSCILTHSCIAPATGLTCYGLLYVNYDESEIYAVFDRLYLASRGGQTWAGEISNPLLFSRTNNLYEGGFISINPQVYAVNDFVFQLTVAGKHKRANDAGYVSNIEEFTIYFDFDNMNSLSSVSCRYYYWIYRYPGYIFYSGYRINSTCYQIFLSEFPSPTSLNYAIIKVYGSDHMIESQGAIGSLVATFDYPCTVFYLGKILMQIEYYGGSGKIMYTETGKPPGYTITFPPTSSPPTVTVTNTPYTSTAPFETPESHTQFLVNAIIPLAILFIPAGLFYYMLGSVGAVVGLLLGVGIGYSAGFVPFSAILIVIVAVAVLFWVKAGGGGGGEG